MEIRMIQEMREIRETREIREKGGLWPQLLALRKRIPMTTRGDVCLFLGILFSK